MYDAKSQTDRDNNPLELGTRLCRSQLGGRDMVFKLKASLLSTVTAHTQVLSFSESALLSSLFFSLSVFHSLVYMVV